MAQPAFFDQTRWSTVLKAQGGEETLRLAALERLLTTYRRPILLEMQSRARCGETEAEELTHQFIHNCLRRDFLKNIDPRKGRFRAFIKACITNFLRDLHREQVAAPVHVSLNETDPDGHPVLDPAAKGVSPETRMDAQWAREIITLSLQRLEEECIGARRGALFSELKPFLDGEPDGEGYAPIAARLRMTEGSLRTATHRLRQRLGELIEEEIKETVTVEEDWRDELRYLLQLLGQDRL